MRRSLDRLYQAALWLSAACLVAIALLVLLQTGGRLLDKLLKVAGREPVGFQILSLSEIAGYLLAASTFLALGATLRAGAHIRVTLLLSFLGERVRAPIEVAAFITATLASLFMTWHVARLAIDSWLQGEISPALLPIPLVLPQAAMALGLVVLTIAFADELVHVLRAGRPSFRQAEDAVTLGKEG